MSVVFPAKSDMTVGQTTETVVGDRHAVRVAAKIVEALLWTAKRFLRIDNPFNMLQVSKVAAKFGRF
jgi:hypothetical protein